MNLPEEIVQPILEIVSYLAAALVGFLARILQKRKTEKK